MSWHARLIIPVIVISLFGCASDRHRRGAVVSYLDVAGKQAYIQEAKSTLKIFHEAALDLRSRQKPQAREELAREADNYIEMQVKPIIGDFEANNDLRTRLEVAELQLLCGLVYLELKEYLKVQDLLKTMRRRYGDNEEILKAALDRSTIGFGNLKDGMRILNERSLHEL